MCPEWHRTLRASQRGCLRRLACARFHAGYPGTFSVDSFVLEAHGQHFAAERVLYFHVLTEHLAEKEEQHEKDERVQQDRHKRRDNLRGRRAGLLGRGDIGTLALALFLLLVVLYPNFTKDPELNTHRPGHDVGGRVGHLELGGASAA